MTPQSSASRSDKSFGAIKGPLNAPTKNRANNKQRAGECPQTWLDRQCQAIGSIYCAALFLNDTTQGSLRKLAQSPLDSRDTTELIPIAQMAIKKGKKTINTSVPGTKAEDKSIDYLALPIFSQKILIGIIALKMAHQPEERQKEITEILQSGSKSLALAGLKPKSVTDFYSDVVKLAAACFEHDSFIAASTALVTKLSTSLGCERVSIGVLKRRHIEVTALSNNARFDSRSNLIRGIADAMNEAIDQDSIVLYPVVDESHSHVNRAHAEIARKFGTGSICTIPLIHNTSIVGALTLERGDEHEFSPDTVRFCEQAMALIVPFLELKRRDERWLGRKVYESFKSQVGGLFGLRYLGPKLMAILVTALLVFASIYESDFRVRADAVLEGKVQREIAASIDGYIATATFRAGDIVKEGDVLAKLDDRELQLKKLKVSSQQQQFLREYRDAMAKSDRVKVRVLNAQIEQTKAEIELVQEQLARSHIVAPFDGVIIDGDLSQSLGSPVERGDSLFKLAPLDGYRVVLKVHERLIAHVVEGQKGVLALSSIPAERLTFMVKKITMVANAEDGHNAFRVEAALQDTPQLLRPGMEGVAKIDAGRARLIWIWTHELVNWLRLGFWSWWP